MIKIQPSGDYVQLIYVDPVQESVQQELKSDTDAFECSYDSDGKLFMQFGAMRFENPDPTDFTINGSAVTDAPDFISKLNALFTGGGSATTIYTGDGSLSGDRTVDLNGHSVFFKSGGIPRLFADIDDPANESAGFAAFNTDGAGNSGQSVALVTATSIQTYIEASYQDGLKDARIDLYANASESEVEYTADTHTFNGNFKNGTDNNWDLNSKKINVTESGYPFSFLTLDPTDGAWNANVGASADVGDGAYAQFQGLISEALGVVDNAQAFFGVEITGISQVNIIAVYNTGNTPVGSLTYTADRHNFNLSEFADNAAAVSGGLTPGDLYHTAGTVKIVMP